MSVFHKNNEHCRLSGVPLRKFHTEQMFVLVRTQLLNHAYTQPVKRSSVKRAMRYA